MADPNKVPDKLPSNFDFSTGTIPDRLPANFSFPSGGGGRGGGARGQGDNASSLEATSPMGRGIEGFAGSVNPIPGVVSLATHPIETVKSLGKAQLDQFKKAKSDIGQGHYSEAVGHGLAGAIPLVGPAAANAGEQIGSGDIAGGVGRAILT